MEVCSEFRLDKNITRNSTEYNPYSFLAIQLLSCNSGLQKGFMDWGLLFEKRQRGFFLLALGSERQRDERVFPFGSRIREAERSC